MQWLCVDVKLYRCRGRREVLIPEDGIRKHKQQHGDRQNENSSNEVGKQERSARVTLLLLKCSLAPETHRGGGGAQLEQCGNMAVTRTAWVWLKSKGELDIGRG